MCAKRDEQNNGTYRLKPLAVTLLVLLGLIIGCSEQIVQEPESTVEIAEEPPTFVPTKNYERISYDALAGWQHYDVHATLKALAISCRKIGKKEYSLSNFGFFIKNLPQGLMEKPCTDLTTKKITTSNTARQFFRTHFTLLRVGKSLQGTMTGYYKSTIRASRTKGGTYQHPIYGLPANMVRVYMNSFGMGIPPQTIHGRLVEGRVQPYFTREQIFDGIMKNDARPILWSDDALDVYILHIQGSGMALLDTGEEIHLSYAGNNGHSYRSVIATLLENEQLKISQASWDGLRRYLYTQNDPKGKLLSINPRYIFFKESEETQSTGSLGTTLIPELSIAVDPTYVPLGLPVWIESRELGNRLVVAQDTGNAIKGLGRADFFWGSGKEAMEKAERTYYKIGMVIFVPNALADMLQ